MYVRMYLEDSVLKCGEPHLKLGTFVIVSSERQQAFNGNTLDHYFLGQTPLRCVEELLKWQN